MNNAEIASENLKICSELSYFAGGERFSLPEGISRTVIYSPGRIEAILSDIDEAMRHKMRCLFATALDGGYDTLILGAWGCGAFGHRAADVARLFNEVLTDEGFDRFFRRIVFSVYVNPRAMELYNYNCFKKVFSPDKK
ncbi:MAG: TIGR02452 family protein [Clostridia bacterium]|nr:TIGR02452 family protein [Clostridia bacterium]